jgi:hypothetical protein
VSPERSPEERIGVLVLRAWVEGRGADARAFRARITSTFELEGEPAHGLVAASPEAALALVKQWLDEFVRTVTPP